jgi:hypothetical protein
MVCFQTKNPNLVKFGRVLQWKMMVYFWTLGPFCYILWTFGIVRGNLVYFSRLVFCTKKNLATLPDTRGQFLEDARRQLCAYKKVCTYVATVGA